MSERLWSLARWLEVRYMDGKPSSMRLKRHVERAARTLNRSGR